MRENLALTLYISVSFVSLVEVRPLCASPPLLFLSIYTSISIYLSLNICLLFCYQILSIYIYISLSLSQSPALSLSITRHITFNASFSLFFLTALQQAFIPISRLLSSLPLSPLSLSPYLLSISVILLSALTDATQTQLRF